MLREMASQSLQYCFYFLRWWVASHGTQHSQIVISKKILDDCQTEVLRIRNIMKFLLGVLNDLEPTDFSQKPVLNYFDQYLVNESYDFLKIVNEHYDNYRYNHVSHNILYFISNKVSALYCHCVKDRLYCSIKKSNERLSAQLVINTILIQLCKALAPILPHLVEEVWQHHRLSEKPFFFTPKIPVLSALKQDGDLVNVILDIKRDLCILAKNDPLKKFDAILRLKSDLFVSLSKVNVSKGLSDTVLCEMLELCSVKIEELSDSADKWHLEISASTNVQCVRCRKFNAQIESDKCVRCQTVLSNLT